MSVMTLVISPASMCLMRVLEIAARLRRTRTPLEIAERVRAIHTPIGGIEWDPPELDATVAKRVLIFLEDRRMLYEPLAAEVPEHCVESAQMTREYLTTELTQQERGQELAYHLLEMRAACRDFLSWFGSPDNASSLVILSRRDEGGA